MKRIAFLTVLISALLPGLAAQEKTPRVVVVNVDKVYVVSSLGQKLGAKLEQFEKDAQAEIKPKVDRANALQEKLRNADTPAAERAPIQRELEDLATQIKRFQEDKTREAKQIQDEGLAAIESKLVPIMSTMAEEKGWDVMLNKVPSVVIMAGPAADVTDQIIERLNREHP